MASGMLHHMPARVAATTPSATWLAPAERFGPLHGVYLRFERGELRALAGLDEAAICARYAAIH